jgi:transglutaminase-like putative cysteine protease
LDLYVRWEEVSGQTVPAKWPFYKKAVPVLFGFLLFLEILSPLADLTGTDKKGLFFLGLLLFLLLRVSGLGPFVRIPACLAIIHWLLSSIFYPRLSWWNASLSLWKAFWGEFARLRMEEFFASGQYPVVRSFGFFLFLWAVSLWWGRALLSERGMYVPFALTALVLILLEAGTELDTQAAIVRVTIYGLVCFSWVRREALRSRIPGLEGPPKGWMASTALLLALLVGMGMSLPKQPLGVEFDLQSVFPENEDGIVKAGSEKKIGYSRNDAALGGPLRLDDQVVFRATVDVPYYWRGEAKQVYTGSGWKQPHKDQFEKPKNHLRRERDGSVVVLQNETFFNVFSGKSQPNLAKVRFEKFAYDTVFVPGQLRKLKSFNGKKPSDLEIETHQGLFASRVRTPSGQKVQSYVLLAEIPKIDEEQLRRAREQSDLDRVIRSEFTALPPSVPLRVQELAEKIASDAENNYDRAKAIETFLRSKQFRYELNDVPETPAGMDFVDHFLFETRRGYCDHFSSSMVVMLRSLGIPARWVKGYLPGEARYDPRSRQYVVTVRNRDAHSWVEVYFYGVGWIPFEPTPAFSNPTPFEIRLDTEKETENRQEETLPKAGTPESEQLEKRLERLEQEEIAEGNVQAKTGDPWWEREILWGVMAAALALSGAAWWMRKTVMNKIIRFFMCLSRSQSLGMHVMPVLIRWLERTGQKQRSQTLREFWNSMSGNAFLAQEMISSTRLYEQARYGKNETQEMKPGFAEKLRKRLMRLLKP